MKLHAWGKGDTESKNSGCSERLWCASIIGGTLSATILICTKFVCNGDAFLLVNEVGCKVV